MAEPKTVVYKTQEDVQIVGLLTSAGARCGDAKIVVKRHFGDLTVTLTWSSAKYANDYKSRHEMVRHAIHDLTTTVPTEGWISVKDGLPELRRRVLLRAVCAGTFVHFEGALSTKGWYDWSGEDWSDVDGSYEPTHWMPLPTPPTEKG